MLETQNAQTGREGDKTEALVYNAGWRRFFAMAQSIGDGTISRLVIQDKTPIFMERAFSEVSLRDGEFHLGGDKAGSPSRKTGWSHEWSRLMDMARELVYCEFHDIKISGGAPVSIGKLVKKDKLA